MKKERILKLLLVVAIAVGVQFIAINKSFAEDNTVNENNTTNTVNTTTTPVVQKKSITTLKNKINTSIHSYNGEKRTPSVQLWDGSKKLIQGKDYTVKYKNNKYPGKAQIIVKGIGNYTGTINKSFYIAPRKAKIKKVEFNYNNTKARITWRKEDYATGYKIYMSNKKNGTYTYIKTITSKKITDYTKKGLNPKKEYYFKVRAYKAVGNRKICKKYSEPKTGGRILSKVSFTAHGSGANRKYNLAKACNTISGLVLQPGENFNWFKVVGPASGARGYKQASVYKNGKVTKGYGGGVCQVSTTVYQGALKAGLKKGIIERHIHSLPVTYIRHGDDATVSYGVQNLIFKNIKDYPIKIVMFAEGETTNCVMYSIAD